MDFSHLGLKRGVLGRPVPKSGVYQNRTHPFAIQVTWTTIDTQSCREKHPHSDPGQKTAQWSKGE